jgi:hypothetical protein
VEAEQAGEGQQDEDDDRRDRLLDRAGEMFCDHDAAPCGRRRPAGTRRRRDANALAVLDEAGAGGDDARAGGSRRHFDDAALARAGLDAAGGATAVGVDDVDERLAVARQHTASGSVQSRRWRRRSRHARGRRRLQRRVLSAASRRRGRCGCAVDRRRDQAHRAGDAAPPSPPMRTVAPARTRRERVVGQLGEPLELAVADHAEQLLPDCITAPTVALRLATTPAAGATTRVWAIAPRARAAALGELEARRRLQRRGAPRLHRLDAVEPGVLDALGALEVGVGLDALGARLLDLRVLLCELGEQLRVVAARQQLTALDARADVDEDLDQANAAGVAADDQLVARADAAAGGDGALERLSASASSGRR